LLVSTALARARSPHRRALGDVLIAAKLGIFERGVERFILTFRKVIADDGRAQAAAILAGLDRAGLLDRGEGCGRSPARRCAQLSTSKSCFEVVSAIDQA
jgi:hypothetical protein